jgi:cytochrome c oxidase subunit II
MAVMLEKRGLGSARIGLAVAACAAAATARADGAPQNWRVGFPDPGSEIASLIVALHDRIVLIGGLIILLVAAIMLFVILRFRASRHPDASRVARAPVLEFGWTVLPVIVLGLIAVPSLTVLSYEADIPPAGLTVKATGYQWFWSYTYDGEPDIVFDSLMKPFEELEPGEPRILTADNPLVLPTDTVIRFEVTSGDVVHSFFVPPLGVQIYAVPGKLNQVWVQIARPGIYYGQCNQICGLNHSFMPIAIEAKTPDDFRSWMSETATLFGVDAATGQLPAPGPTPSPAAAP